MIDIYGGKDPREIPSYSARDASRYLNIPSSTIRSWAVGYHYKVREGNKKFEPVISIKKRKPLTLTFMNLIEIHVLRAIRKYHKVDLAKVRAALDYINEAKNIDHPLVNQEFYTDGVDLFINCYSSLINASQNGKIALKNDLIHHLERIESDEKGLAIKLFPFTRNQEENNPRFVMIDPRVAFGRMVIADKGIPIDVIGERFFAGDSPKQIADDYECEIDQIQEAIRCVNRPIAA